MRAYDQWTGMNFWVRLPVPRFIRENAVLLGVWRVVMFIVLSFAASSLLALLLRACPTPILPIRPSNEALGLPQLDEIEPAPDVAGDPGDDCQRSGYPSGGRNRGRQHQHGDLQGFVTDHAGRDAMVYTDEHKACRGLPRHDTAPHSVAEYVSGQAHVNGVESFWAALKRGYHGS